MRNSGTMPGMRSRVLRIYLDACCYNRPFDSPAVSRNHLEAEAVITWLLEQDL